MNKRFKRLLSLLLCLLMFVSVAQPAFAVGTIAPVGDGMDREIGEGDLRPFGDLVADEEGEEEFFTLEAEDEETGLKVTVDSPFGALPTLAELRIERVDVEDVREAIEEAAGEEQNILMAVDISFWMDGIELEPEDPVRVIIQAPELEGVENMSLIHVPDEDAPETVALIDRDDLTFELESNEICFKSSDFSVYAVVEEGDSGDEARAEVNFYNLHKQTTPIATVYVKNSDELLADGATHEEGHSYINDIVYDPGIGEIFAEDSGLLFRGWTIDAADANPNSTNYGPNYDENTKIYTVDEICSYLDKLTFVEGQTKINIYAVILKYVTITYIGETENVSLGAHTVMMPLTATSTEYTVNMAYTPGGEQNFEGWLIADADERSNVASAVYSYEDDDGETHTHTYTAAEIAASGTVFPNTTVLQVKGNITFSVSAPMGHWLVFNENGKGATYCAPQFIKSGEVTHLPRPWDDMHRNGYSFAGWFYGTEETVNGKVVITLGAEFHFGDPLEENTTVYAKWNAASTANYTVIFWKQNIACDGYDFDSSQTLSGNVGASITATHNNGRVTVTGATAYTVPTGFQYERADSGKSITPEGDTIVNVYCERQTYTLTFVVPNSNYITYYYGDDQYSDATMSSTAVTNQNTINTLESSSRKKTITGFEVSYTGNYSTTSSYNTYYIKKGESWYQITAEGRWVYNANTILRLPSSGNTTVKTITAKYETYIGDQFPIVGTDGYAYDHGERWKPGTNSLGWNEVMTYVDAMREQSVTFTLDVAKRPLKTMTYWVEALPTDTDPQTAPTLYKGQNNTVVTVPNGMKFVQYFSTDARYTGVTEEDLVELDGYNFLGIDTQGSMVTDSSNKTFLAYIWDGNSDGTVNIYYTRKVYTIHFEDGIYVDGSNKQLTDYNRQPGWKTVSNVVFGSSIASYNKGGENYYTPENTAYGGFVFEGWFIDDACTSGYTFTNMPKGDLTVYAKWRQVQFRVFLHPNVPNSDTSLNWGSESQAMNFRISEGGKISAPTGTRTNFEFVGWFTDPELKSVFNASVVALTHGNVTTPYDKTVPTDNAAMITNSEGQLVHKPLNKYAELDPGDAGYNADTERFWITTRFDLYAKWKAVTEGAKGINIVYDAYGFEYGENDFRNGSGAPSDTVQYEDNSYAIAQAASTAPVTGAGERKLQFLYWEVMTWNGSEFVPSGETVYPGEEFLVLKANARVQDIEDPDPEEPTVTKIYTIQLRAKYDYVEAPLPTHITWYANNNTGDFENSADVAINAPIQIPMPAADMNRAEDVVYIGWDKLVWEDHVFLGWARVDESTLNGTAPNYEDEPELGEADLFLKYVADDSDLGYHFEAQLPKTANSGDGTDDYNAPIALRGGETETEWKKVNYVAADEFSPYHAMYAVWAKVFYIYHSATGVVEKVTVNNVSVTTDTSSTGTETTTRTPFTVDIANRTTDGYLYGGYYASYAGTSDNFAVTLKSSSFAWTKVETDSLNTLQAQADKGWLATGQDKGMTAYDGANVTWTVDLTNANDPTKKLIAESGDGLSLVPTAGAIYYIKEVPAEKYLLPYFHYTYRYGTDPATGIDGKLTAAWLISDIDDGNYTDTGFVFLQANNAAEMVSSLTVKNENGGNTQTITPAKFNVSGANNMLTYREVFYENKQSDFANNFQVLQYWVTPDGLIVTGTTMRNYTFTGTYASHGNIQANPATVASQILASGQVPAIPTTTTEP